MIRGLNGISFVKVDQKNYMIVVGSSPHGSLEGVGGLKKNEAYHWKADALLIQEM